MKKGRKRIKKRIPSGRRKWDVFRGFKIVPYTKKGGYGNYAKKEFRPEFENEKGIVLEDSKYYEEFLLAVKNRDGDSFLLVVKQIIYEEFDGKDGEYYIAGYEKDCSSQLEYMWSIPVLKFEFFDGEIFVPAKRSPRVPKGRYRKHSYNYKALDVFPELEDKVV